MYDIYGKIFLIKVRTYAKTNMPFGQNISKFNWVVASNGFVKVLSSERFLCAIRIIDHPLKVVNVFKK